MKLFLSIYLMLFGTISFLQSQPSNFTKQLLDSLNQTAFETIETDSIIKGLNLVNKVIEEAIPLYPNQQAKAYVIKGLLFTKIGDYPKAETALANALKIRRALKDTVGIASVYNNYASLEEAKGHVGDALEYVRKAIVILEQIKEIQPLARAYINLGNIFKSSENFPEAIQKYEHALGLISPEIDAEGIAIAKENLGEVYRLQEKYDAALRQYATAYQYYKEVNQTQSLAQITSKIGAAWYFTDSLRNAINYYIQSIQFSQQINNPILLSDAYFNLSDVYMYLNQPDTALIYALKADTIFSKGVGDQIDKREISLLLSDIYADQKEYETALIRHRQAYDLNTSINEQANQQKFAEERAKLENAELALEVQAQAFRLKQLALIGLLLLGVISAMLYLYFKRIQDKEQELQILKDKEDLKFTEAQLDGEKKGKEKVAIALHDEVAPTVVAIKREIEFSQNNMDDLETALSSLQKAISIADKAYENLRRLAYSLKPIPLEWLNNIKLHIEQLKNTRNIESKIIVHGIDKDFDSKIGTEISKIFSVLLDNVQRHAKANKVAIDMTRIDQDLIIIIEDNGVGFNPKKEEGIGLRSVKDRVKRLNGTININSRKDKGTTITINIPLLKMKNE